MTITTRPVEPLANHPERRRLADLPNDPLLNDIVKLASALCGVQNGAGIGGRRFARPLPPCARTLRALP